MESTDLKQHNEKGPSSDRQAVLVLNRCFDIFRRVCEDIKNFKRKSDDGPLFQDFNGLSGDLDHALSDLEDLNNLGSPPFDLYAATLRKQIGLIKESLGKRETERAHNEAMKAFTISTIFRIHQTRDRILEAISKNPDETSIETLLEEANRLDTALGGAKVFPNRRTGYEDRYRDIRKRIGKLKEGLEFHQGRDLSHEDRKAMYGRLEKYLRKIDFSTILSHWN